MKVRFYCDVPTGGIVPAQWRLHATNDPPVTLLLGTVRLAFDVDFPPEYVRTEDVVVPAEFISMEGV